MISLQRPHDKYTQVQGMARLWDVGLATTATSALGTVMFLILLQRSPGSNNLVLQKLQNEAYCVQQSVLCDGSMDYSYLMKTNPAAAALWRSCRVTPPQQDGIGDVLRFVMGHRTSLLLAFALLQARYPCGSFITTSMYAQS
jgi:hypothetical protein